MAYNLSIYDYYVFDSVVLLALKL